MSATNRLSHDAAIRNTLNTLCGQNAVIVNVKAHVVTTRV
jgi:hypothetical protein